MQTLTSNSISFHKVLPGYYTTPMIETGSAEDGSYDIHTFTILRPEDGTTGWNVRNDRDDTQVTNVASLPKAKQLIADQINSLVAA